VLAVLSRLQSALHRAKVAVIDVLKGATVYDMIRDLEKKAVLAEHMLMLVVIGDMLGFPVSSYYRLKLLPYWVHRIKTWKTSLLKEYDILERLE
jgi:hypothetical protein